MLYYERIEESFIKIIKTKTTLTKFEMRRRPSENNYQGKGKISIINVHQGPYERELSGLRFHVEFIWKI